MRVMRTFFDLFTGFAGRFCVGDHLPVTGAGLRNPQKGVPNIVRQNGFRWARSSSIAWR